MSIHSKRWLNLQNKRRKSHSWLSCRIEAHQNFKREFLMSPRQMRKYWDDRQPNLAPLSCFSRWMEISNKGYIWDYLKSVS